MLRDEGVIAAVIVEPAEYEVYRAAQPGHAVFPLPEDGQGLGYSRRHAKALGDGHGAPWFWIIDDDIKAFHRFDGTKGTIVPAREALLGAQEATRPGVGQLALEYQQYAWSAGGKVVENSYADVCVALRKGLPAKFRLPIKTDRDFTMQVIASGSDVLRVTKYAFSCPAIGSNKGGQHELYAASRDAVNAQILSEMWPWCCEVITKKNGRVDAKIHWRKIRQRRARVA